MNLDNLYHSVDQLANGVDRVSNYSSEESMFDSRIEPPVENGDSNDVVSENKKTSVINNEIDFDNRIDHKGSDDIENDQQQYIDYDERIIPKVISDIARLPDGVDIEHVSSGQIVYDNCKETSGSETVIDKDFHTNESRELSEIDQKQQLCISDFETNQDAYLHDSQAKGNYGEMRVDQYFSSKGYENISVNRVVDLKTPTGPGIDGVYVNKSTDEVYIVEVKYNLSELGDTTDGKQMSEKWKDNRLDAAVGKEKADEIRIKEIENTESVKSVLARVDVDGNVSFYELDNNANILGEFKV